MTEPKMNEQEYIEETKKHTAQVQWFATSLISEIAVQVRCHDDSKLEEPEKECFMKILPRLKDSTYGSREYKEALLEIKPATEHHNQHNRHHIEHHENGVLDMDLIDIIEMLCDWKAASMRHRDGDILKSIEICQVRFNLSPEMVSILLNTVKRMEWE